jgi:hypothetical protein
MNGEPRTARGYRIVIAARSTILFAELSKRNRRRILLDPASKILNPRVIRHASIMVRLAAGP